MPTIMKETTSCAFTRYSIFQRWLINSTNTMMVSASTNPPTVLHLRKPDSHFPKRSKVNVRRTAAGEGIAA